MLPMRAILRTGRIEMRTAELLDAACSIGYAMLKNGADYQADYRNQAMAQAA